jgi:hypothetical protein
LSPNYTAMSASYEARLRENARLRRRENLARGVLRQDEERDEPAPRKEAEGQVVPERDEREDEQARKDDAPASAERNVNVSAKPSE